VATFQVDCSRACNIKPRAFITNLPNEPEPENSTDKVLVEATESSKNVYKLTYTPSRIGSFLVNVVAGDLHLGGSPFDLRVGMDADPSKVVVNRNELKSGIVNVELRTLIDASGAGPGELTANCFGPRKAAACCFEEKGNGFYMLSIVAQEVGKHMLQIRYNGMDVEGGPFLLRVFSPPDASKVKVAGCGILHGVLDDFRSEFVCDTKGAGAGQLTVRIRGPKSAFKVEMKRESEKDRKITCKYDPLEVG
jgi:filamin